MSLPEQLLVLQDVVSRLDRAAIAYMITGSVAMNYYARPRMTRDIDVVIEIDETMVDRFSRAFEDDFHLSQEAVRRAVAEQGVFSSIHVGQVVKVDFVVRKISPYREEEFSRRRPVDIMGIRSYIVAPEDLILSKLEWSKESGSELQARDVANLIGSVQHLDWFYMERWAPELTVMDLLERLR